jgi:hypothetical protein
LHESFQLNLCGFNYLICAFGYYEGGGGAAGMAARSGADMASAMAAAQAERAKVKQLREEGKKPVGLPQKRGTK